MSTDEPTEASETSEGGGLPFDLLTILVGLWQRKLWIVAGALISLAAGFGAGRLLGSREYQAETILLYKPAAARAGEAAPSLSTQVNMVKIQENIEEVRKRLRLKSTLQRLAAAVQVRVQRDSDLMTIDVTWQDPREAAAIANTLRDVFLESQIVLRYRKELKAVEALHAQAQNDKNSLAQQAENVERILSRLRSAEPKKQPRDSLGDINLKFRRLRDAITDDKDNRANTAELEGKQAAYERAQAAWSRGLIAEVEYLKAKMEYERVKAIAVDTPQIASWKEEIKSLDKVMIPEDTAAPTANHVLDELMVKGIGVELEAANVSEKLERLKASRDRLQRILANPALARQSRTETAGESQNGAQKVESGPGARSDELDTSDFVTLTKASTPLIPTKSNRTLIALALAFLGSAAVFAVVLGLELLRNSIRSPAEATAKLKLPVLGALPESFALSVASADARQSADVERLRVLSRTLRSQVSGKGVKILIASALAGEESSSVAASLAVFLGRQDENVFLVQAHTRTLGDTPYPPELLIEPERRDGLGDYLLSETNALNGFVRTTACPGVELLGQSQIAADPELLGSQRMRRLLEEASSRYTAVLLDAPPVLPYVDTSALARWCDCAVLVVKARTSPTSAIKEALARFKTAGIPVAGVIVSNVEPIFLKGRFA